MTLSGDRIVVVVQKQRSFGGDSPGAAGLGIANKVRRGDIRHAVVVRAAKELQRKDGSYIKFDDNACVLINKNGDPIGTRLTGMGRSAKQNKILTGFRCCWGRTPRQTLVENIVFGPPTRMKASRSTLKLIQIPQKLF